MKKFGLVMAVAGFVAAGVAVGPRAEASPNAPQDGTATQCTVPALPSSAVVAGTETLPSCDTFPGLCFVTAYDGPARAAHGSAVRQVEPCADFAAECTVPVVPPKGPSRATHVPGGFNVGGPYIPGDTFTVPEACLQLAATGLDAAPVVMFGLALFGVGTVLSTLSRRRRAARVRVRR